MIVHQLTLFAMFVLFTKRSGGKGMGWGKDLVLVGHEGGKAKSLKGLGVGLEIEGEESLSLGGKANSPRPNEAQPGSVWQVPENTDNGKFSQFDQWWLGEVLSSV